MALIKIISTAVVKFVGKTVNKPSVNEVRNTLQFNNEDLKFNDEVLTFTEN